MNGSIQASEIVVSVSIALNAKYCKNFQVKGKLTRDP